ncbi:MAG TPA: CvpA family protein [Verrucomicrobiae bacterium]
MNFLSFNYNWFDFLAVLVLLLGMARGRKRGLSQEVIDMFKWLLIVVVAAYVYEPWGTLLAEKTVFSLLFSFVAVYVTTAIIIKAVFGMIKGQIGEKLTSSDVFGRAEYYLGMVGGAVRYACILIVGLALLNARQYSPQEVAAWNKAQKDNFGDIPVPSLSGLQQTVFNESFLGQLAKTYLQGFLIKPTPSEVKDLAHARTPGHTRERMIDEVMGNK